MSGRARKHGWRAGKGHARDARPPRHNHTGCDRPCIEPHREQSWAGSLQGEASASSSLSSMQQNYNSADVHEASQRGAYNPHHPYPCGTTYTSTERISKDGKKGEGSARGPVASCRACAGCRWRKQRSAVVSSGWEVHGGLFPATGFL
jgi:hypothetical protein